MIKSYEELMLIPTFEERFHYLKIGGIIGRATFGFERYLNQTLYRSRTWREEIRPKVLLRDNGCDLGIPGREIFIHPIVHHINPITIRDIKCVSDIVFDLNNLITVSHDTHNAIHFANESLLVFLPTKREKGDHILW